MGEGHLVFVCMCAVSMPKRLAETRRKRGRDGRRVGGKQNGYRLCLVSRGSDYSSIVLEGCLRCQQPRQVFGPRLSLFGFRCCTL